MPQKHELFVERAESTGRWWENPWWAQSDCDIHFTVTLEAVQRGAGALREHFPAEWYLELARSPRPNIVFPKLCLERSTFALEFIANVGARLSALKNVENLQRPVRALRESYGESALLELESAEAFVQEGFRVSFPKEGGAKSPDLVAARNGQTIAIECKRLGDEDWEDWEDSLMSEITSSLPWQHEGRDIVVHVELNSRLSEIRFGGKEYATVNKAISAAITSTIVAAIKLALSSGAQLPHKGLVNDIAKFWIDVKKPGVYGGVTGMERSVPATFRRMFQNGVFRALDQLPKEVPGTIVLYSKHAPPSPFLRLLLDAATEADVDRFADLTGILVCTLQTWFVRSTPTFFSNAHTRHSEARDTVTAVLKRTFNARLG